ncbi:MAG: RraA family protein [Nocardioidaceae bacterium]
MDKFRDLPVAVIGDAMDRLGMCDAGIRAVWPGAKCTGHAFTVLVREGDNAGVHAALPYLTAGDVLVVNGGGIATRALVGERIALRLAGIGAAGMVIDGCVRDSAEIAELGFPVWSRGTTPAGPYKNGPAIVGEPLAIGGVAVAPGDIIAADTDGVIVIPQHRREQVLADALRIAEEERRAKTEQATVANPL